jgi:hypothetical protein
MKVHTGVGVQVESAAVGEQNFEASVFGSHPITSQQRHIHRRCIRLPVALEHGRTVDE